MKTIKVKDIMVPLAECGTLRKRRPFTRRSWPLKKHSKDLSGRTLC